MFTLSHWYQLNIFTFKWSFIKVVTRISLNVQCSRNDIYYSDYTLQFNHWNMYTLMLLHLGVIILWSVNTLNGLPRTSTFSPNHKKRIILDYIQYSLWLKPLNELHLVVESKQLMFIWCLHFGVTITHSMIIR